MAVSVTCPGCAAACPVSETLLGKKIRCKACQETFVAAAAKVAVGGGEESPARRSNAAKPVPGNRNLVAAAVGGGVLLVAMAGVTAWALTGGSPPADPAVASAPPAGPPKIDLAGSTPPAAPAAPVPEAKSPAPKDEAPAPPAGRPAAEAKGDGKAPWFVDSPSRLPFAASRETKDRVLKSAAFIKMYTEDSGASGSGWVAEPGIVITNAHVVGMRNPVSAPPRDLKVVFQSGLPDERTYQAKLLALDRENDLAVLKIEGDNLPPAVPIARSSDLMEGNKVYAVGFPWGAGIERMFRESEAEIVTRVKFRESSIAGRMADSRNGSIKRVQIEGGVDPGNSGGMIVDTAGNVRGIVVEQRPGTNMKFVIPSEYAVYLLRGRVFALTPGQPYKVGGAVKQPLAVKVLDPLKRIKVLALEMWAGPPGTKFRPAADKAPAAVPGDGNRWSVALPYDSEKPVKLGDPHVVEAECDLPPLKDGQVYWVQPRYVNTDGVERWGEAVALETAGLPVDRRPATLSVRHQPNTERVVDIDSHLGTGVTSKDGEMSYDRTGLRVKVSERVTAVAPDGTAKVSLKFKDLKFIDEDEDRFFRSWVRGGLETALNMTNDLVVTKRGLIKSSRPVLDKVPVPARGLVNAFNMQTVQSLEALSLALPDQELKAGESWKHDQNFSIRVRIPVINFDAASGSFSVEYKTVTENALFQLTYRYVGTRTRDGAEEAVVEYRGNIVKGEGNEVTVETMPVETKGKAKTAQKQLRLRGMEGVANGSALVDLATGAVTLAQMTADMQFEVPGALETLRFGGAYRVELFRQVQAGAKRPDVARYLPNYEILFDPQVGAPSTSVGAAPR
jgi:S1-C subfamily serine protease